MNNSDKPSLNITLAQIDPVLGDLRGNFKRLRDIYQKYKEQSDLIVFPELFICGYPPEDLLLSPAFIKKCEASLQAICDLTKGENAAILTGYPWQDPHSSV